MFYVYILRSINHDRFYTGSTDNTERRLSEHNAGRSTSTKRYAPFELIYSESYNTRAEAVKREKFFKTGHGRDELKKILNKGL